MLSFGHAAEQYKQPWKNVNLKKETLKFVRIGKNVSNFIDSFVQMFCEKTCEENFWPKENVDNNSAKQIWI